MTSVLRSTLLFSLVPVVFTIVGAAAGTFAPSLMRLRGHVLHLAAGVVFSVVAVELLPEIQRRGLVIDVVLGFALGIGAMLLVDTMLDRIRGTHDGEKRGERGPDTLAREAGLPLAPPTPNGTGTVSIRLFVAVGIDFLLDGLLLGVGFAAGARIGILLALAEAAEQLSVGLALAGELTKAGVARSKILLSVSALGSLVFASAVVGATLLKGLAGGSMELVLSFGLAALLYLVTEELLREAHEEPESTSGTVMFFVGFLAFLVVGMVLE